MNLSHTNGSTNQTKQITSMSANKLCGNTKAQPEIFPLGLCSSAASEKAAKQKNSVFVNHALDQGNLLAVSDGEMPSTFPIM